MSEIDWVQDAAIATSFRIAGAHPGTTRWGEMAHASDALGEEHVRDMLAQIAEGWVIGRKAHRWLGWAQCAVVAAGVGTLEDMKAINKAASDAAKAAV